MQHNTKKPETPAITQSKLGYREAIDTFINFGETVGTVAVEEKARAAFFEKHKEVENLLKRKLDNPLLEEGNLTIDNNVTIRERKGELFLTHEAITLLLDSKIEKYKSRKNANCKNIFVVKDDFALFINILKNLQLKNEEDAKFVFITNNIHATPIYIRNENNRIKCFIVESEGNFIEQIASSIYSVFGNIFCTWNGTRLQVDYFSCGTFAIKAMMYFMKHGKEIFPYIEKEAIKWTPGQHILPGGCLMPELLKMCQTNTPISEKQLKAIVSKKRGKTLSQYTIDNKMRSPNNNSINTAAIKTKYHHIEELSAHINKLTDNKAKISPHAWIKLPKEIEDRHKQYSTPPKPETQSHFIDDCIEVIKHLDDSKIVLNPNAARVLRTLNDKYTLFQNKLDSLHLQLPSLNKKTKRSNSLSLAKLLFIAYLHESNNFDCTKDGNKLISIVKKSESDLLKIFANTDSVIVYFKKNWPRNTTEPMRELCNIKPPKDTKLIDKNKWSHLMIEDRLKAAQLLPFATIINNQSETTATMDSYKEDAKTFLNNALHTHIYPRAKEYPELADLCIKYNATNATFEKCLDLRKNGKYKQFDLLPDIEFAVRKNEEGNLEIIKEYSDKSHPVKQKKPEYIFKKLPINDLRGFFLGEESKCCQTVGTDGDFCAVDGMTSPNSGFYVVLDKRNRIIAQTWAWINDIGDLVFDSWEYANRDQNHLWKPIIEEAARRIVENGVKCVLAGSWGNTPTDIWNKARIPVKPITHYPKSDAGKEQYTIIRESETTFSEQINKFLKFNNIALVPDKDIDTPSNLIDNIVNSEIKLSDVEKILKFIYVTENIGITQYSYLNRDDKPDPVLSFPAFCDKFIPHWHLLHHISPNFFKNLMHNAIFDITDQTNNSHEIIHTWKKR